MWKMTVMKLNADESALLKQYAETGGADAELVEILRLAYLNLNKASQDLMLSPILCHRLHEYVRGTVNRQDEMLARMIFGRALRETA